MCRPRAAEGQITGLVLRGILPCTTGGVNRDDPRWCRLLGGRDDGSVHPFGSASYFGSVGTPLNKPIVGMATSPTGNGYSFVATDGGIFTFGDAHFHGSVVGQ